MSYGGAKKENVIIPDTVTKIETVSFYETELISVVIPSSVMSIGDSAFSKNKLTSVIIKGKNSSSDFSVYGKNLFDWAEGYSDLNIQWNG